MNEKTEKVATITIVGAMPDGGAGFAIVNETGEKCFLSARTMAYVRPAIGDEWKAHLSPNKCEPDKTPWFCQKLLVNLSREPERAK